MTCFYKVGGDGRNASCNSPCEIGDERGNAVASQVDLRREFVDEGRPVDHCAGRTADAALRRLKAEWYWAEKQEKRSETAVTYYYERAVVNTKDDVEAAVLKALTGKARGGRVYLLAGPTPLQSVESSRRPVEGGKAG